MFSENVRLRRVSSGALSRSEVGGAYASGESLAERVVTATPASPVHYYSALYRQPPAAA